jgi:hypothetical protein
VRSGRFLVLSADTVAQGKRRTNATSADHYCGKSIKDPSYRLRCRDSQETCQQEHPQEASDEMFAATPISQTNQGVLAVESVRSRGSFLIATACWSARSAPRCR